MSKTQLKRLIIKKFRALTNVEIEFGTHVTVICGKNGTSKSSILGVAAQIFSFEKDYTTNTPLNFQTVTGSPFKSLPAEHFRFSDRYDTPGSLDVEIELFDGYSNSDAGGNLQLSTRTTSGKKIARPILRNNTTTTEGNKSRNFTHPVIFLSLRRLQPISTRDYEICDFDYLNTVTNKRHFINLNNELLNKTSSHATGTSGSINSAVAYGDNYDHDSVSAGEDNAGQIILALMSFRKLQSEYSNYKGGLLLIDEADAGLFPAAQVKLIEILERECSQLSLQVVMTSHSPTLIEETYNLSQKYQRKFKTIYLSDTFGPVRSLHDISWLDIYADLHTTTLPNVGKYSPPKINVYFEDGEAQDMFKAIMYRDPTNKFISQIKDVSLGCANYIQLAKKQILEFSAKSVIVLDGDVSNTALPKSIITLPGTLPPDQLIFEFLFNLPSSDPIWINDIRFTRHVLSRISADIISALSISTSQINLKQLVASYRAGGTERNKSLRELFKNFYNDSDFQGFLNLKSGAKNPWKKWVSENQLICDPFRSAFKQHISFAMQRGFGVDTSTLKALSLL